MTRQLPPSPPSNSAVTTKVMRANKAAGTTLELSVRSALWKAGIRGYRLNWGKAPGRPDICFPGKRIAIFINGCFWHRCPICAYPLPKTNAKFWKMKFELNVERDQKKLDALQASGWSTITLWECDIKRNLPSVISRIATFIQQHSD